MLGKENRPASKSASASAGAGVSRLLNPCVRILAMCSRRLILVVRSTYALVIRRRFIQLWSNITRRRPSTITTNRDSTCRPLVDDWRECHRPRHLRYETNTFTYIVRARSYQDGVLVDRSSVYSAPSYPDSLSVRLRDTHSPWNNPWCINTRIHTEILQRRSTHRAHHSRSRCDVVAIVAISVRVCKRHCDTSLWITHA